MLIAVIQSGGKQYLVKQGDTIQLEKIAGDEGGMVQFPVLFLADDTGATTFEVGKPMVTAAKVSGKIVKQFRAKKIHVIKFKSKVHYRRHRGHRQHYTKVLISEIKL